MTKEERFAFGKNWQSFLAELDEDRMEQAVISLQQLLGLQTLEGKRFMDLGCGSGLFSLAAQRLGAEVISIDYDKFSVACSEELRDRFGSKSLRWDIKQGSVLDPILMQSLGDADVVYSWGVLHHTGAMDEAISNAAERTKPNGLFCLAIYNDQGGGSRRWLRIKKIYNAIPSWLRFFWVLAVAGIYECKFALARLVRFKNPMPFRDWKEKRKDRGMSAWHDWLDWIGGLPFEVAKPEQIVVPLRQRGFVLENIKTVGNGWGCNEYVFSKSED
jgi:2-polyprenyl-6-hydroxyphenyl methylase/3-demethylubiquinone-9 3-methyltransferase